MATNNDNLGLMSQDTIEEQLRQERLAAKRKELARKMVHEKMAGTVLGDAHDMLPENLSESDKQKPAEGPYNFIDPKTGEYVREDPRVPQKDSAQSLPPPDPDKQQDWAKKQVATGADGQSVTGADVDKAASYSDDRKERKEQKKEAEGDIKSDFASGSAASRKGTKGAGEGPGKGKNLAGKAAGKALSSVARAGGPVGAILIYTLAILNDVPDLIDPILEWLTIGIWGIVDFMFDVVVFLGFRYFLREHLNIPGLKGLLYGLSILEIIPIPVIDHIDVLPFWTICAWLALRKIKEEQANAAEQAAKAVPAWVASEQASAG